ncbi:MAG TPA: zinc-ribbon domain-containing protein [Chloroflexia bacterium]|nr:zinc-ribbon domain-containing protein [Chloroflexia bacterium]
MHCVRCGQELPDDANFCLRCSAPQQSEALQAHIDFSRRLYRQMLRIMVIVVGIIFLVMFLVMVSSTGNSPWGDLSFWAVLVGIATFMLVPQIAWRDNSPPLQGAALRNLLISGAATAFVGLGFGALIVWGAHLARSLTSSYLGTRWIASGAIVLGNAALMLALAYTLDRKKGGQLDEAQSNKLLLGLMGAQVLLNGVALLVFGWRF